MMTRLRIVMNSSKKKGESTFSKYYNQVLCNFTNHARVCNFKFPINT